MPPISGFGHFFGFAAEINFATSIFAVVEDYILVLLSELTVFKLASEKTYSSQAIPVYEAILDHQISITTDQKEKRNLQNKKSDFIILKESASIASTDAATAYEDLSSDDFKKKFELRFKPLFPLAGTFSAIFLIFCGFCEYCEKHTSEVCYNTILLISIFSILLALANIFGWCGIHKKEGNFRNLLLNVLLVISAFIFWGVSHIIKAIPIHIAPLTIFTQKLILYFALFTSVFGFICLFIKIIWVNYGVWGKYNKLKNKNALFSAAIESIKLEGGISHILPKP